MVFPVGAGFVHYFIEDVKCLSLCINQFSFMFINKHCNQVSDAIGRAVQAKEGPDSVWLGDCTKCLYNY